MLSWTGYPVVGIPWLDHLKVVVSFATHGVRVAKRWRFLHSTSGLCQSRELLSSRLPATVGGGLEPGRVWRIVTGEPFPGWCRFDSGLGHHIYNVYISINYRLSCKNPNLGYSEKKRCRYVFASQQTTDLIPLLWSFMIILSVVLLVDSMQSALKGLQLNDLQFVSNRSQFV